MQAACSGMVPPQWRDRSLRPCWLFIWSFIYVIYVIYIFITNIILLTVVPPQWPDRSLRLCWSRLKHGARTYMRFVMSDTTTHCTTIQNNADESRLQKRSGFIALLHSTLQWMQCAALTGAVQCTDCSAELSLTGARKLLEPWSDLVTIEHREEKNGKAKGKCVARASFGAKQFGPNQSNLEFLHSSFNTILSSQPLKYLGTSSILQAYMRSRVRNSRTCSECQVYGQNYQLLRIK